MVHMLPKKFTAGNPAAIMPLLKWLVQRIDVDGTQRTAKCCSYRFPRPVGGDDGLVGKRVPEAGIEPARPFRSKGF